MNWSMVSWSHHRTPIDVRERLAFSATQIDDALRKFQIQFPETESVLLSTCNRVEMFCASTEPEKLPAPQELGSFVSAYHGFERAELFEQMTALRGGDAIRHLFLVAASLDSMIVGESQVLSQVKAAYEQACGSGTAASLMHRAFQRATVVARRVANETEIHRRRISVPSVAVSEIATEFFERFDDKRILLIGAGEMGTETLRYLKDAGAEKVRIINRNSERANELAQQFGAKAEPWERLDPAIIESDLIVSTTSSTEPIMSRRSF
ncbi:MAG: glutamyl-tRNA reductase [Pirellulaceae bacterium]